MTEGLQRRIVLPIAASLKETDHVLGHELVHAFQYDILGQEAGPMPLWFIEGMAEYLSLGPRDTQTAMWLRDAAREDRLPSITDLDNPRYFPYRFGHAFWAYVTGRWGDAVIGQVMGVISPRSGPGASSVVVPDPQPDDAGPAHGVDAGRAVRSRDRPQEGTSWPPNGTRPSARRMA